jgi:2-oxoglutarate ferredoxin oxidoreductase subunit alpha
MHADPAGVLTGSHFLDGDHACCEGALAAGARFSAGYPITPSTKVVERFASRVPTVGGTFIQMETNSLRRSPFKARYGEEPKLSP